MSPRIGLPSKALLLALISVSSLARGVLPADQPRKETPPNILYIFTDQQHGEAMSCAGNQNLKTSAMDRIAAQGVRFSNAYCAFPLCVPSRMSMVSSRMPHEAGIFLNARPNNKPFPFPTLGNVLSKAGYKCGWVGKWHLTIPQGKKAQHGFGNVVFGGGYGDKDHKKAAEAAKFIRQPHKKPFLLVVSFNNPHDCCELSRGQQLKMGQIPPPPGTEHLPALPGNFEIPDLEPDYLRAFQEEYAERVFRSFRWDRRQFREYLWGYNRLVEMVDGEIGKVLDALRDAGLEENTVIIFSSDHGDGASRHRWNQKFSLYDESAGVPFIVARKGMPRAGHVEPRIVSAGLDLLPTICDYAGVEPPEGCLGQSVRALVEGDPVDAWRDYVVTETGFGMWANVDEDHALKARMVRSQDYKYIAYDSGERREQLIDMLEDPGEMTNLADSPAHEEVLLQHRRYLAEWTARTRDRFTIDRETRSKTGKNPAQ